MQWLPNITGRKHRDNYSAYVYVTQGCVQKLVQVMSITTQLKDQIVKQFTADILIPHRKPTTLVFRHQQWLVGDAPFPLKSALKLTHPPSKNADFDRFPLITSQP